MNKMNEQKKRSLEWKQLRLGEILTLEYGKAFPEKRRLPGPYPVYGSNGIVGRAHLYFIEDPSIVVGRKGSAGEVTLAEPKSWPIDTAYYVVTKNRKIESIEFVYYLLKWLDPRRFIDTTTKPGLNRDRVYEQFVPLPPFPVQERIVQILRKADDIQHKRKKALESAHTILPALFLEMFGDPVVNPKNWPREPIGSLVFFDTAQVKPEPEEVYPYMAPEHIESETGDYTGPHPTVGHDLGSSKHLFTSEHILYCKLRPYLNKVVLPHTNGICSSELVPIRPGQKLLREFLAIYLRLPFFVSAAVQKSQGTKMPRFGPDLIKQEIMIVPPLPLQRSFCMQVNQWMELVKKLKAGSQFSYSSFTSLLYQSFTGELTAKWETANADWIAEQVKLHEKLPRLLVLALIREKINRINHKARNSVEVFVTALMKYAFILQMEGASKPRLYEFIPYHYGPFAKELYADLERLKEEGLVAIADNVDENKVRISLANPKKAAEALIELPEDLRQDVTAIIDAYGDLDHNALLNTVYEKYPAYAQNSHLLRRKGLQ